jgi:hypothetical protein
LSVEEQIGRVKRPLAVATGCAARWSLHFRAGAPGDPGTAVIRTMRPQAGSPAIDRGSNPDGLMFDQRGPGFMRVLGARADIGAIEAGGSDQVVTAVPTLHPWLLAMLSALLAAMGWRKRRRLG